MTSTRRTTTLAGLVVCCAFLIVFAPGSRAQLPDLVGAAIAGDLPRVRSLVDAGVPVDTADRWGSTALAFAASEGHVEVVRHLLERGADPSLRERFFDQSPLARALGGGPFTEGLPPERLEIALLLLRSGADDRELALETALARGNLELARAAVESGPLLESRRADLRVRAARRGADYEDLLDAARTRPAPAPPRLSPAELAAFAGSFEASSTDVEASVEVDGDGLVVAGPIAPTRLAPSGPAAFRSTNGAVSARFFGRAQTVEGFELRAPEGRWDLRQSVADLAPGATAAAASRTAAAASASRAGDRVTRVPGGAAEAVTMEWRGFRGENGSGIGDGIETPVSWDLASGEGVLWRADLPGLGNSSPIVVAGRVIVTTAVAGASQQGIRTGATGAGTEIDEQVEHRWLALAFEASTGAKLWETEIGRGVPASRRHMKATQANSTPASDGERIVVVFPTAGMAALDLDGRVLWKRDLGPLRAGAFNDPTLEWGFASSPVIHASTVILQVDLHENPYVAAWDLATGAGRWRTARDGVAPSWATPVLWPTPDGVELVANASIIRGYDADDGRELWSLAPNSEQVVATPVIADGVLFVSSGYPPVKPIYALRPGVRGRVEAAARGGGSATKAAPSARLDAGAPRSASGDAASSAPGPAAASPVGSASPATSAAGDHLVWRDDRGGAYMPSPLVYRGLLYIVHHNGRLVAYDAATGAALYKARFSQSGTFTSSPVAANGKIYTGTEEGLIYVFASGPAYRELAVNDMTEPVMATPAIANGVLLVRTPSRLVALGGAPPAVR